jgi:hypothetical protein
MVGRVGELLQCQTLVWWGQNRIVRRIDREKRHS